MALIRIWNADPYSLAAIWKIEEPETFFEEALTFSFPEISLPRRRLEKMAGRYLLRLLQEDFPLSRIAADLEDKPRIDGNRFYFSISHSWPYVTAILNPQMESGIDIQCWHPRIDQLQHKFLNLDEQYRIGPNPKDLHLAWSAKEAAYKWAGKRGLRFSEDILITSFEKRSKLYEITANVNRRDELITISVEGLIERDYSLAYIIYPPKI